MYEELADDEDMVGRVMETDEVIENREKRAAEAQLKALETQNANQQQQQSAPVEPGTPAEQGVEGMMPSVTGAAQ